MELDPLTVERLRSLSELAGETELAVLVMDLARSVQSAVPSFLALRFTMYGADQPITITANQSATHPVVVRSSLRLEMAAVGDAGHHQSLVYLAGQPNAFLEFTSSSGSPSKTAKVYFGDGINRLVVDADVPEGELSGFAHPDVCTVDAEEGHRCLDRAVGVMMSCGSTPEAAKAELAERALWGRSTPVQEAQKVLNSQRKDPPSIAPPGPASP